MFFNSLNGLPLEYYFKKADNKATNHTMKHIDFIYTINLDQRPEKFAQCTNQLNKYGIYPYRFSAVNGWELTLDILNDVGVKYEPWMPRDLMGTSYPAGKDYQYFHELMHVEGKNYFCHTMGRGTIGIVLSHLSVLQDAYNSGYNTIWVMEDDIHVIHDPHKISTLIEKLDETVGSGQWDILFTDRDTKGRDGNYVPCFGHARRPNFSPNNPQRFARRKRISNLFRQIGARYGTYSMIVRRSGMQKILEYFKKYRIFLPYDMDFFMPNGIKIYTVLDDIVSTDPVALSDNGKPGYLDPK